MGTETRGAGGTRAVRLPAAGTGPEPLWIAAPAQDALVSLGRSSVDAVVTGVPGFWLDADGRRPEAIGNENTLPEYVARVAGVFREVRRVLRPQGTAWLHAADSTYSGRGRGGARRGRGRVLDAAGGAGVASARKSLLGVPWRLAHALSAAGWSVRAAVRVVRAGPARLHAGDRPGRRSETLFLLARQRRYRYEPAAFDGDPAADVWVLPPAPRWRLMRAFPDELAERCLRLSGVRAGETVLDPFAGTGTTAAAAAAIGAQAIGVEIRAHLARAAAERLRAPRQMRLLAAGIETED